MSTATITPLDLNIPPLTFELGEDVPTPSGGIGKWTEIDRPRGRNAIQFTNEGLLRIKFDIMLDKFPDGDVEADMRAVFALAAKLNLPTQPTRLRIAGPIIWPDITYVLTDVDASGRVLFNNDGVRCRQQLKLEITEYLAPDLVVQTPPPAQAAQERSGTTASAEQRTYTVKAGDTLSAIAASLLGGADKWHALADLNGVRDPRSLKIGQVLRLP